MEEVKMARGQDSDGNPLSDDFHQDIEGVQTASSQPPERPCLEEVSSSAKESKRIRGKIKYLDLHLGVLSITLLILLTVWIVVMDRTRRVEGLVASLVEQQAMATIAPAPVSVQAKLDPLIETGRAVCEEFECNNCHKISGQGWKKRKGPVLDNIGSLVTAEQLREKLWNPSAWYAEGFEKEHRKVVMPDNYPDVMNEAERDALVVYLLTLKNTAINTPKPIFDVKRLD